VIEFVIPGPAVAKGRPRATSIAGKARMYTPARTAKYEAVVAAAARAEMGVREPLAVPISVYVQEIRAIPASWSKRDRQAAADGLRLPTSRPDADNVAKAVLDGMAGIVFVDDAAIVDLAVWKRYGTKPRVEVSVVPA
jgi:Holliday junction resolvase RusA-like endonuclease